jgi:hypothetical protein
MSVVSAGDCRRVGTGTLAKPLDGERAWQSRDARDSPDVGCDALARGFQAVGEGAEQVGEAWANGDCRAGRLWQRGVLQAKGVEVAVQLEAAVALGLLEAGEVEEGVGVVQEHCCLRLEWGSEARGSVAALNGSRMPRCRCREGPPEPE